MALSEYDLIEIAARFRALEEAIEYATVFLLAWDEDCRKQAEKTTGSEHETWDSLREDVQIARDKLDRMIEQARKDFDAMQEVVRLAQEIKP